MIYLDTSALIKLYIRETGSADVQAWVTAQDEALPVWELQEMELINALHLKVFWKELTKADARRQIGLFHRRRREGFYFFPDVDRLRWMEKFHELSSLTPKTGSRTLDIQHVACACLLTPSSFISFDERQRKLAGKAGLQVLPESL